MTQPPQDGPDEHGRHDDPTVAPGSGWQRPDLSKPTSPSGDQAPPAPGPAPAGPSYDGWGQGPQQGQPGPPPPPAYGTPYGSAPYGATPYGSAPYGGVPGYAGYPFARPHGGANTAMGLGITSLASALLTFVCCVTFVGVAAGPFAIVLALRARKEMAASPGAYSNEGAATTGLVTGIIGTVLGLVAILLVVLLFGSVWLFDGS